MRRAGWVPAAVALGACGTCYLAGWQGTDWAAQAYRASQVTRHGLALWDPGWYGGTFPLSYSLIYPLVTGYLGLWPVAAVSAAAAAYCWDAVMALRPGYAAPVSWYFALSTVIEVSIGQLPTLSGEALALGAVLLLARWSAPLGQSSPPGPGGPRSRRTRDRARLLAALALSVMAGLTSPVVGCFLALSLAAWAIAAPCGGALRPPRGAGEAGARGPLPQLGVGAGLALVTLATTALLPLLFPGPGYFPFSGGDLAVVVALCALMWAPALAGATAVRAAAILYGLVSIALFLAKTQMGDNDARFAAYIGVPLALAYLWGRPKRASLGPGRPRRPRPRRPPGGWRRPNGGPRWGRALSAVLVGSGLVVWEWAPMAEAVSSVAHGASSTPGFYHPLSAELAVLSGGRPVRVEVPPTLHHWESDYVAAKFPLARGWERQLDMAYDPIFYTPGALDARTYRSWLLANGVSYVALPAAPLDYAATGEARLLRSGRVPGLRPVWHNPDWLVWRVEGSPGLASGPARVVRLGPGGLTASFYRPGTAVLRVRWSAHWSLPPAQAATSCLAQAPGGWVSLTTSRPAALRLSAVPFEGNHGRCSAKGRLRSVVQGT